MQNPFSLRQRNFHITSHTRWSGEMKKGKKSAHLQADTCTNSQKFDKDCFKNPCRELSSSFTEAGTSWPWRTEETLQHQCPMQQGLFL